MEALRAQQLEHMELSLDYCRTTLDWRRKRHLLFRVPNPFISRTRRRSRRSSRPGSPARTGG
jgi:hypothetical protein